MMNKDSRPTKPPTKRPPTKRPATIGEISGVIGCDVRELIIDGWTWDQVNELVDRKMAEQQESKPEPSADDQPHPFLKFKKDE